jgi:hypothetical protein
LREGNAKSIAQELSNPARVLRREALRFEILGSEMMRSSKLRPLAALLLLFGISVGLAACGDTWSGMREDTSENLEKAKDTVD